MLHIELDKKLKYFFFFLKVCRNGKCVAELENIIPDYTHVTQTISRSPISRSDTANNIVYNTPLNGRTRNKNRSTRSRSRRISSTTSSTTPSTTVALYESRSDENVRDNYDCVDQVKKMVHFKSFILFSIQYDKLINFRFFFILKGWITVLSSVPEHILATLL